MIENLMMWQGTDPVVSKFIETIPITDRLYVDALDYLVKALKDNDLWVLMKHVYPMIGGNSNAHRYNLVNSNIELTWHGTLTHNVSGTKGNGTTGYASTDIILEPGISFGRTSMAKDNAHFSFYSTTDSFANSIEMGAYNIVNSVYTNGIELYLNRTSNAGIEGCKICSNVKADAIVGDINSKVFAMSTRTDETLNYFSNGIKKYTNTSWTPTSTITDGSVTVPLYIFASNEQGTPAAFSLKNCAFASIGCGMTDSEASIFNNIVQQYQQILGRKNL